MPAPHLLPDEGTVTPPPRRRRRPHGPGWVPNQHGAWAMLGLPLVVGSVAAGLTWRHALLLGAWFSGYLAYFAVGLWLRARRRARYWPPVRAYSVVAGLLGAALVVTDPRLLLWGAVFVPLVAVSLHASSVRRDRSMLNDTVTVVATCLMPVVAHGVAGVGPAWLPGADSAAAWGAAGVLLAYFYGTVLYVKSMIRDRGDSVRYAQSVTYHVGLVVLTVVVVRPVDVAMVVLAAGLAVRAAVVPRRWPALTPRTLGLGEILACALVATLLLRQVG